MESRRIARQNLPVEIHLGLLDGDADQQDEEMKDVHADQKAQTRLLVGILITITGLALATAIKLTFGG